MNPQPELDFNPERPSEIITRTSDEFQSVCSRSRAGEFVIEMLSMVTGSNSAWKIKVRYE